MPQLAQEMDPAMPIDGEMQFDAAVVPAAAKAKYSDLKLLVTQRSLFFLNYNQGTLATRLPKEWVVLKQLDQFYKV